jgi:hypothetical protein
LIPATKKQQKKYKIDELIHSEKGIIERFIIKETHISPDNKKIGLLVLYIINVF